MSELSSCCEKTDLSNYNPRTGSKPTRTGGVFNFGQIANPIPAEVKDPDEIRDTFKTKAYIPYAGNADESCYGLLKWLNAMKYLSPTHGSCIESIKSYAFGGKLGVSNIVSDDFDLEGNDKIVNPSLKEGYAQFLSNDVRISGGRSYRKLVCDLYESLKCNGNYFIEVVLTESLGQRSATINYHNAECCLYEATRLGSPKVIAVSPRWDYEYITTKRKPRRIPVYPNFSEHRDGTKRTMIHVKSGNYEWYGRPDWLSSFMYVYREFQDANYLIKLAANDFTAQAFIEIEEADSEFNNPFNETEAVEAGFDSVADRVQANFSAASDDPQTVMLISRPYGSKPAFVYQFKPNTNQEFYKTSSEIAELKIIQSHQWSKRFLGENQTQGFSTNVFIDELKVKEAGVLNFIRDTTVSGLNTALRLIVDHYGYQEFRQLGVCGQSNFNHIKGDISETELNIGLGGNQIQPSPQGLPRR